MTGRTRRAGARPRLIEPLPSRRTAGRDPATGSSNEVEYDCTSGRPEDPGCSLDRSCLRIDGELMEDCTGPAVAEDRCESCRLLTVHR